MPTNKTWLQDVILGNNGSYPAAPGWDYATGLGSFDVAQMKAALH